MTLQATLREGGLLRSHRRLRARATVLPAAAGADGAAAAAAAAVCLPTARIRKAAAGESARGPGAGRCAAAVHAYFKLYLHRIINQLVAAPQESSTHCIDFFFVHTNNAY